MSIIQYLLDFSPVIDHGSSNSSIKDVIVQGILFHQQFKTIIMKILHKV